MPHVTEEKPESQSRDMTCPTAAGLTAQSPALPKQQLTCAAQLITRLWGQALCEAMGLPVTPRELGSLLRNPWGQMQFFNQPGGGGEELSLSGAPIRIGNKDWWT